MIQNDRAPRWNNRILDAVPAETMRVLAPHLVEVEVARGTVTTGAGEPLRHVDFPIDAVIAILAVTPSGKTIEAAAIGPHFAAFPALSGGSRSMRFVRA